ncbi:hypothetical protein F511_31771 [Dorcoceras hygrometricum]|uniref:Uncharacterized protein n=1 Tax=Dorcoceras hygrometricum TaxID=472368 RepID=A0A2Z7B640_9LAMI|nr:hypothetical protein F511_31771 [Dorcoceras hygrometricum]
MLDTPHDNAQADLTGNPVVIDLTNVDGVQEHISSSVPATETGTTNVQDVVQTDPTVQDASTSYQVVSGSNLEQQSRQLESDPQASNGNHQLMTDNPDATIHPNIEAEQNPIGSYLRWNRNHPPEQIIDEADVDKVAVVKRKYVSKNTANKDTDEVQVEIVDKKRPATASDAPAVKKKRTATGRAAPAEKDLALVTVGKDAVPIQIVEPISAVPAVRRHAQKRKAPKRKLRLSTGSDDEIVEQEPDVEHVEETQKEQTTFDDVDKIIDQVLTETAQMEQMWWNQILPRANSVKNKETDIQLVETAIGKEIDRAPVEDVGQIPLDEESQSIVDLLKRIPEDMMLPSVTAAEPTKIKFGHGISITVVTDGDWYKENLPKIAVNDKGKAPLVEPDTVKGHPARVILRRLAVMNLVKDIAAKEEHVLTWVETDSVQDALQRRLYIVAKYREMLLRKFLEAHRAYFSFGQPWSAMALQIIDSLSAAHSTSVKIC